MEPQMENRLSEEGSPGIGSNKHGISVKPNQVNPSLTVRPFKVITSLFAAGWNGNAVWDTDSVVGD